MISANSQKVLINIARRAGREIVMPHFRQLSHSEVETKSCASDLVTIADKACELFISEEVKQQFPDWEIVGEEATALDTSITEKIQTADTCLIIDPIDGTWNYAHGVPDFGIILAVVMKGVTQFGLLYDPVNDDWMYANLSEGAYFQRTSLQEQHSLKQPSQPPLVLKISPQQEFYQLAGIMSVHSYTGRKQQHLATQATHFARINNLPSCPAYRQLSLGHFHFSLTYKMLPWDHAAGVLIYSEAGGICRPLDGSEYKPYMLEGEMLATQSEKLWLALANHFSTPSK
ncbi:inositol monophosphatase [Marinomonas sp. C2222]|uniref:Inositol monophosphatase n=1 Tax=Marinomonas sargassi TaxID=2984494 RepID=A0ABT2YS07_9GAMM|nr:inositol monophosphatase [Marinomonas sargassi]MCV2402434.1 inositol monophosphatase [Marinomonas sargassi]